MITPQDIINILLNILPYELARDIVYKYGGYQTPTAKIISKFIKHIDMIDRYKPNKKNRDLMFIIPVSIKQLSPDLDLDYNYINHTNHVTSFYQCYYYYPLNKIPNYKTMYFITSNRSCYQQ